MNYPIWEVPLLSGGLLIAAVDTQTVLIILFFVSLVGAVGVLGYMVRAVLRVPGEA